MTHSPAGEGTPLLNVQQTHEQNEISGTTNVTFGGSFVPPGAGENNKIAEMSFAMNNTTSVMTTQETFSNNKQN